MKKTLKIMLVVAIVIVGLFLLTGCGDEKTTEVEQDSNKETETPEVAKISNTNNWEDFYETYTDRNREAYETLEENTDSFDILTFIVGDIDLAMCSSFFTNNEAGVEMAFSFFGFENIEYNRETNVETVNGTFEGEEETYRLEFNNNLAKFTLESAETNSTYSILINGDEWAKSYSNGTTTVQIYQQGENIYYGYDTEGTTQYIEANQISKATVTAMPKLMQVENGEFISK